MVHHCNLLQFQLYFGFNKTPCYLCFPCFPIYFFSLFSPHSLRWMYGKVLSSSEQKYVMKINPRFCLFGTSNFIWLSGHTSPSASCLINIISNEFCVSYVFLFTFPITWKLHVWYYNKNSFAVVPIIPQSKHDHPTCDYLSMPLVCTANMNF